VQTSPGRIQRPLEEEDVTLLLLDQLNLLIV